MPQVDLTLEELGRVLYFLDRAAIRRFIRAIGVTIVDQLRESDRLVLDLLVLDWLAQFECFSDAQRQDIVIAIRPQLQQFSEDLATVTDGKFPAFHLAISDYRWVLCTLRSNVFDMEEGEDVEAPAAPTATSLVGDVTVLWLRARQRILKLRRANDGTPGTCGSDQRGGTSRRSTSTPSQ